MSIHDRRTLRILGGFIVAGVLALVGAFTSQLDIETVKEDGIAVAVNELVDARTRYTVGQNDASAESDDEYAHVKLTIEKWTNVPSEQAVEKAPIASDETEVESDDTLTSLDKPVDVLAPLPKDEAARIEATRKIRAVQEKLAKAKRLDGTPYYKGPINGMPSRTLTQAVNRLQVDARIPNWETSSTFGADELAALEKRSSPKPPRKPKDDDKREVPAFAVAIAEPVAEVAIEIDHKSIRRVSPTATVGGLPPPITEANPEVQPRSNPIVASTFDVAKEWARFNVDRKADIAKRRELARVIETARQTRLTFKGARTRYVHKVDELDMKQAAALKRAGKQGGEKFVQSVLDEDKQDNVALEFNLEALANKAIQAAWRAEVARCKYVAAEFGSNESCDIPRPKFVSGEVPKMADVPDIAGTTKVTDNEVMFASLD